MRCKKNIILTLEILISFLRNLIGHFTDKEKILILSLVNITLCFSNYNNASALDYSSNVGIGFTFNPTLSISLSSNDLVIPNLVPGSMEDSNSINVSVATNAAYGYTLSANVGDDIHNNSNLTHSNNTDIFSSIATDANLSSLDDSEDSNIWGYSYKNNTVVSPVWSNYNGLSSSSNAILLDNSNAADSTGGIDFKIAAKAGNTQPSGTYTGTINFIAVTKVAPMSLLDSFIASGAEQLNGYYKMQDMTHDICEAVDIEESELQLIDVRDNKVYWVAKLKDGNCWMTQNLDFSIQEDKQRNIMPLTSETTDLVDNSLAGAYSNGYRYHNDTIIWTPKNTAKTIYFTDMGNPTIVAGWQSSYTEPYSAKEISNSYDDQRSLGVLYNWPAAIASNDSSSLTDNTYYNISNNPQNSICPKNWRLPVVSAYNSYGDFNKLNNIYNEGLTNSDANLLIAPLYFVKAGSIVKENFSGMNAQGVYISSTVMSNKATYGMDLSSTLVRPYEYYNNDFGGKSGGFSVRCLAR